MVQHQKIRVGIDIGGTFTDFVLEKGSDRLRMKLLTTHHDPAEVFMVGLSDIVARAKVKPSDVDVILHGTTLATNAVIERKGALTALITTEGFRDTIAIGTEGRPDQYDVNIVKPVPLVPRRLRLTINERISASGRILVPLDSHALAGLVAQLRSEGVHSVAVALLHSYANNVHEQAIRDYVGRAIPGISISLSSEISPELREYERFSTTCANAYVAPIMERYLSELEKRLLQDGYRCSLQLMLSSGGLTNCETAKRFPVRLMESGPAGGAIFACDIAQRLGIDKAISFDMGGTTAKLCIIDESIAQTSRRFEVARVYRFRADSGIPIRIPVIEMVEIGAGGGSIARIDAMGRVVVGPESAGSNPGPAAYGIGGTSATVTDANVVMGRMDPDLFAGGRLTLSTEKAGEAIAKDIGGYLGLTTAQAAFAVTEFVCENMASAARVHAIESGKNTRDRTLIVFGGAAPLHACQMADRLNIDRIIIPLGAGVGSAIGFLRAPISFQVIRTLHHRLNAIDLVQLNTTIDEMQFEVEAQVRYVAGEDAQIRTKRQAYMRYQGQGHEIAIDMPNRIYEHADAHEFQERFNAGYRLAFGRDLGAIAPGEIISWSLVASADAPSFWQEHVPTPEDAQYRPKTRDVFCVKSRRAVPHMIHDRGSLVIGETFTGPAIVTEDETSTVVAAGYRGTILPSGDIELVRQFGKLTKDQPC
jgi:N-methylhydantoinase A